MTIALIIAGLALLSGLATLAAGLFFGVRPGPRPVAPWLPAQRDGSDQ